MKISDELQPMMSPLEINLIDQIISGQKPKTCLEWGSGWSSVYFPNHESIQSWLSVEHNGHYVQFLSDKVKDNTNVIWVPENEWYVDCVKHTRKFDFILIDGQQRGRCLEIAKEIINENGVILLHDSGRLEYQEFIAKHKGLKLSEGEIPVKEGGYAHRGLTMFKGENN